MEGEWKITVCQNSILNEKRDSNQMGEDGESLLNRIYASNAPEWLRLIPAVEILRQVWIQQFYTPVEGKVKWRSPKDMPPSTIAIHSHNLILETLWQYGLRFRVEELFLDSK